MYCRSAFICSALIALQGCQTDDLSDQVLAHVEYHKLTPHDLPSDSWIEKKGSLVCDEYLTRIEEQDFCASAIPDDWVPLEINGETYYMQPLSAQ